MSKLARTFISLLVLAGLLALARPAFAGRTIEVKPGADVEQVIAGLGPGDELVVRGGSYKLTARFTVNLVGTEADPIVIRAADGETPHFSRKSRNQNIWDIDRAEHVLLRGIEFSGGSAGLRIFTARHLTIEGCNVHDTGDVAIRANDIGPYEGVRILGNHVHHTNGTGEGMYLGCNNNACQFANGLIANNYVHHTNHRKVEQGDGIELKEGSYGNVIRDNVIHDTGYPCILTYSTVGNGAANVIERNVMWGCGDHAIQSAADAVIRNNLILGSAADGIAMQPHQAGTPSNLVVVHNTVLMAGGIPIVARAITGSVVIANNAVYAASGTAISVNGATGQTVVSGNVGAGGLVGAADGLAPGNIAADLTSANYGGRPPMDLFPTAATRGGAGGALVGAGNDTYQAADDFNGTPRRGSADVGGYAFAEGGNPGWPIGPGFKAGVFNTTTNKSAAP